MNQPLYKGFIHPHHSKLQAFGRTFDLALVVASLYASLILCPLDREYMLACFVVTASFSIFAKNNELYKGDWRGAPLFV